MSDAESKSGEDKSKCPKCESELHHVEKMGQHYCFSCETYYTHDEIEKAKEKERATKAAKEAEETAAAAKEDKGKPMGIPCPTCGNTTAPVKNSENYYCYACEEFFTKGGRAVAEKEEAAEKTAVAEAMPVVAEEKPAEVEVKPAVAEVKPAATEVKPVAAEARPAATEKEAGIETITLSSRMDDMKSELTVEENLILDLLEGGKGKEEKKVCPTCGLALTYVQKYGRWYCYTCRKYPSEEGFEQEDKEKEAMRCSECGSDAEYIQKYDRWYCRSCKKYLPTGKPAKAKAETEGAPLCSQCGKPTTWVATYERYYCYPCKKYAPKTEGKGDGMAEAEKPKPPSPKKPSGPACEICGRPTSWIAKYNRHYCYYCQKYIPKAEAKGEEKEETKAAESKTTAPLCSTCGKPTTWIAKYERYYCYPCKKYAPK